MFVLLTTSLARCLVGFLPLGQIAGRQLRRRERVVDELALREQLEWELAQADLAQQQLETEAAGERRRHAQHLRLALEAQRLLSVVRATVGQFVDSLAVRPAKQAIEVGGSRSRRCVGIIYRCD